MTWTWRPPPTWTLKLPRGDVDLTPYLLEWDVAYGCSFDAGSGQWTMQTATGSLVLDNRLRAFDLGSPAAIITSADVAVPQLVVLSLGPGGETLWQGAVILSASARLRGDAAVRWQLRGHYFQVFRSLVEWRQLDNSDVGSTPHELIRRVLRDAVDGDAALDVTSPASVWPDNIQFQDVTLAETGGAAWNRLGQSMGSIPFEDSNGLPGMSAMHKMAEGQQRDIPDSMRALDDSVLHSEATLSLWSLDVVTRDFVAATEATIITTGAQNKTHAEAVRFDFPDDVIGVEWVAPQPTAAAGWSLFEWRAYPAQDRTRADTVRCVIRKDNDMAHPSGVRYIGRLLTQVGETRVNIVHPPIDAAGLLRSRRQSTPPWVKRTANYLGAFYAMNRFVNEQKVTATLRYPLWAVAEADRLPTHISDRGGLLVPGSMSRYRIDADRQIDMITGLVHLEGSAVTEPTATISGVTYSGASNYTGWIELLPRNISAFNLPAAVHPVYGPTPLSRIPPTPTLTVNGATVTVAWPETLGAVDIRRRSQVGFLISILVDVIAEDEDGTIIGLSRTYDDTPTADVPLWYSIRHPVSSGQWSDWAGPVTTTAPPAQGGALSPIPLLPYILHDAALVIGITYSVADQRLTMLLRGGVPWTEALWAPFAAGNLITDGVSYGLPPWPPTSPAFPDDLPSPLFDPFTGPCSTLLFDGLIPGLPPSSGWVAPWLAV